MFLGREKNEYLQQIKRNKTYQKSVYKRFLSKFCHRATEKRLGMNYLGISNGCLWQVQKALHAGLTIYLRPPLAIELF